MKKVLFVATVGGFVSQFEMNDVKLLQSKGCEVHYAANFDNNVYHVEENLYEKNKIKKHNVTMAKSPLRIFQNQKAYKEIKRIIDSEGIDVVHCHTPVGGVLARKAAARSKRKPKVIYTAHGFHFYKGAPIKNWCIYYLIEKKMAKCTDAIVTINEEDYTRACKFKLREGGKAYKIPGIGIDLERFNNSKNAKSEATNKSFKIVSISEINKNKNHKVVIQGVKKLIDDGMLVYYDIYGKGPYEEYLKKYIKKLDIEEYVQLRGYTDKPEDILREADCFAFSSIREGLGMSALEAMASGVPVVASDNRGTREYMLTGHNGIVCRNNNAKEYAEAIRKLRESVETRKTMGRNGRETVKKFSIARAEKIMTEVYNNYV